MSWFSCIVYLVYVAVAMTFLMWPQLCLKKIEICAFSEQEQNKQISLNWNFPHSLLSTNSLDVDVRFVLKQILTVAFVTTANIKGGATVQIIRFNHQLLSISMLLLMVLVLLVLLINGSCTGAAGAAVRFVTAIFLSDCCY